MPREKYEALDEASRAEVDAALDILMSDAAAAHDAELMARLDRIEAGLTVRPEPTPPAPDPSPVPPPPRNDPTPPVANPPADPPADPPVTPKRRAWWGNALDSQES